MIYHLFMFIIKESSDLEFLVRLLHVGLQSLEVLDKQEFHFKQVIINFIVLVTCFIKISQG